MSFIEGSFESAREGLQTVKIAGQSMRRFVVELRLKVMLAGKVNDV